MDCLDLGVCFSEAILVRRWDVKLGLGNERKMEEMSEYGIRYYIELAPSGV